MAMTAAKKKAMKKATVRKSVWFWLVAGLAAVVLSSVAAQETSRPTDGISPEALAVLTDTLTEDAYVQVENCIQIRRVRRVDVLDSTHVLFVTRKEAWLNRLMMNCRGLRPGDLLEFSQYGSRLCRHDSMLARERGIPVREDFPPRCHLGSFERVTLEQAEMLREQFRQLRKARRAGRVPDAGEAVDAGDEPVSSESGDSP
jgi:hypothetical protein